MNAQEIVKALGGRWSGKGGSARCPAHDDHDPSLSVSEGQDGKLLVKCHANCDQRAVWGALQDRGLVERAEDRPAPRRRRQRPQPTLEPSPNQDHALAIWRAAQPATGTPAEDYLRGRGLTGQIPPTIRYHPGLAHADTGLHLPCMVAAVCDHERKITGIQRTYLTLDGRKAPLSRPKMALGSMTGSAVRLAPTTDRVWLTEGVEDALALVQMLGEPSWAVLGTSGFKNIVLPENIRQVILAPDGDAAGQGIIREVALRLAGQGREVRAAKLPPDQDWCDMLDTYEERAGILDFDFEICRVIAEGLAREEVFNV